MTDYRCLSDEECRIELANAMYTNIYGDFNDNNFKPSTLDDIADWLSQNDHIDNCTVLELCDEWQEYLAEEVGL